MPLEITCENDPDWEEYDGPFEERHAMNRIMPGASFMSEYVITIG